MGINPCAEIVLPGMGPCTIMDPLSGFYIIASATVDGEKWYTLHVGQEVFDWLKTFTGGWMTNNTGAWIVTVDVHEHVYAMMVLRWA